MLKRSSQPILSWHPSESLSDQTKLEIAKRYIKEQGYGNCDYTIVQHNDTDHEHVHIITSRVDRDGVIIKDNNERYNGRRICMEIENEYDLIRTAF